MAFQDTHAAPGRARELKFPRIAAIGGGTGLPVVLRGLADAMQEAAGSRDVTRWSDHLTGIVTVTDDGGSSGRLRREIGMLPPGDIHNCLAALASHGAFDRLLQHRLSAASELDGHTVGSLALAALTQMTGNFALAVSELAHLLRARGRVYPSTIEDVTLCAEYTTGEYLEGESAIGRHGAPIRRVSLARHVQPLPEALRALINADAVIIGPGSLYTSVLPNLLVDGMASTLSAIGGVRIYVANLMTQPGEADGLTLADHLRVLRDHTGSNLFDYVLVNGRVPRGDVLLRYRSDGAELLEPQPVDAGGAEIVVADLLDDSGDQIRHDSRRLAAAILEIVARRRPAEDGGEHCPVRHRSLGGTLHEARL